MRQFINIIAENTSPRYSSATPEELERIASEYCDGMGATPVGSAKLFDWKFVQDYPLSDIEDFDEMAEWMQQEIKMWAQEGQPDRYNDEITNPIREPIILYHSRVKGGQILDGMHRVGGSAIKGAKTIPAIVGTIKKKQRSER